MFYRVFLEAKRCSILRYLWDRSNHMIRSSLYKEEPTKRVPASNPMAFIRKITEDRMSLREDAKEETPGGAWEERQPGIALSSSIKTPSPERTATNGFCLKQFPFLFLGML